ncbi:T9SS type A sorting domain-containing protein [bacterium]|nr:T9SS type A sorting domain-containing protein [bacterium]
MSKKVIGIAAALLLFAALVPGLSAQTVLLEQNFNSAWTTTTPPTGWTIIYNDPAGTEDWHRYDYTNTGFSGGSARLGWVSGTWTDRLISPTIDCSNPDFSAIWVALNVYYDDFSGAHTAQFRGSSDGGETFPNVITDYDLGGSAVNYGPVRDSIDISSFALGEDDVVLEFFSDGNAYNFDYWYVDNFVVYGIEGGGPPSEDTFDWQLSNILRPANEEEGGVGFKPTCKIYLYTNYVEPNYAADPVWPADVECRITDLENMTVVYDKVLSDVPFPEGYTTVDAFPLFTPEGGKQYKAVFIVTGADDAVPANDNMEKKFIAILGEEVTPTEILAPLENQQNKFSPSAKFLEKAGVDEAAVVLHYRVENAAYMAVVSEDSVTHDFTANEEYTATFPEVNVLTDGGYTITFWATSAKGVPISKPEKSLAFTYTGIEEKPEPVKYALSAAGNAVSFSLAKSANVSLKVYDAAGNVVAILASGSMDAGSHQATWNARPGVYFVKLATPEYSSVCKAIVVR